MGGGTRLVRLSVGIGLAVAASIGAATTASAHATLIASNPGNGTVLATSPDEVQLQFDVPVNARLSEVQLKNQFGKRLGTTVEVDGAVSSLLTIALPPLSPGVYRLDFQARDDTDLHQTGGAIVFGVGEPATQTAPVTVPAAPSYLETGTRWLELAGTCLLVGVATVWLGILPALGRRRTLPVSARGRMLAITALGYLAIVIGKAGQLLVAAAGLRVAGVETWPDAVWTALSAGRFGLLWLAGMACAAIVLVAARAAILRAGSRVLGGLLVLATAALLVVSTATSHGSGPDGPDADLIAIRVIHLGAAGLWVGGLTVLVFLFAGALRGGSPEAPAALMAFRRFTGLAFIAVGVLTVSGLMLVGRGVASPAQLTTTQYGLTLIAKLIAGALAIGFGVRHVLLLSPPRGGGVGGPVKLARSVPLEVGVMLVVLWGAAALGATAPAPPAETKASVGPALMADTTSQVDDLVVHSSMGPGQPGANNLQVTVTPLGTGAHGAVSVVTATLTEAGQVTQTLVGRANGPDSFEFPPARAAVGRVDVQVTIVRGDGAVERTSCDWTVAAPPAAPVLPTTPWATTLDELGTALGVGLLGFLVSFVVMSRLRLRMRRPATR